jgi:RNA polymerase sigma-70 factor, ECF subfamily
MDECQSPQTSAPGWTASTAVATEPPSDAAMPERLADSEAIDDAYARILRYARTLARDPTEAEDLTQEVFLRAFRARDTLHDPQARLSWLYRITTHAWVDRVRQRARRPEESEDAVEEAEVADAGPGLQQVIEQNDMSACVQGYLVDLPDGYRAVLLLHDLHELPGPDIAEMLDLSLATVKIRLHRARLKLRAALAAGCLFSHDERNVLVCEQRR